MKLFGVGVAGYKRRKTLWINCEIENMAWKGVNNEMASDRVE